MKESTGAINETLVSASIPVKDQISYLGMKILVTQDVMYAFLLTWVSLLYMLARKEHQMIFDCLLKL